MKNIVLCGSMGVKDDMLAVKDELVEKGYNVLMPKECMNGISKNIASRKHFERIADKNNEIILIVNTPNKGRDNYIGPNSFAEIAMAFFFGKKVYLYGAMYEPYRDELLGWGVIELDGNLNKI